MLRFQGFVSSCWANAASYEIRINKSCTSGFLSLLGIWVCFSPRSRLFLCTSIRSLSTFLVAKENQLKADLKTASTKTHQNTNLLKKWCSNVFQCVPMCSNVLASRRRAQSCVSRGKHEVHWSNQRQFMPELKGLKGPKGPTVSMLWRHHAPVSLARGCWLHSSGSSCHLPFCWTCECW